MRISVRMFLDDFINPPLRDYVVFYLEKVEKTLISAKAGKPNAK